MAGQPSLLLTIADAGLLLLSFAVPLVVVLVSMPPYLRYLTRRGKVVDDVHKKPPTKVPSPAGPILLAGTLAGEVVAYVSFGSMVPVALIGVVAIAFAVGIADDLFVMGARMKPLVLLLAGVPLVLSVLVQSDLYEPSLTFPLLAATHGHFIIYTVLAIVAFPIVANAFNMMDSFNGELSWFGLLTFLALLFGAVLHAAYVPGFSLVRVASTLPLVAVAAAFLVFNRYPSRAFDGNSGSLLLGAAFAGLAIMDGVEVAAVIALVPAILNSFYTLSSVGGLVERRRMAARPTYLGDDGMLHASVDRSSPITLVRLILLGGPLGEKDLVRNVIVLSVVACLLSAGISVLTWVL
jgi:UDP-N-acetylmuramyl pentapeptide phosphotransferase/UDP-N-acetylglucosamine-1-phosphate transferase